MTEVINASHLVKYYPDLLIEYSLSYSLGALGSLNQQSLVKQSSTGLPGYYPFRAGSLLLFFSLLFSLPAILPAAIVFQSAVTSLPAVIFSLLLSPFLLLIFSLSFSMPAIVFQSAVISLPAKHKEDFRSGLGCFISFSVSSGLLVHSAFTSCVYIAFYFNRNMIQLIE